MADVPTNADALRSALAAEMALPDDELYASIVPDHMRSQLYSRAGLVARGRSIFATAVERVRGQLCESYRGNRDSVRDAIDLAVLVVPLIAATSPSLPAIAIAALIAKIGIDQFCSSAV